MYGLEDTAVLREILECQQSPAPRARTIGDILSSKTQCRTFFFFFLLLRLLFLIGLLLHRYPVGFVLRNETDASC